MIEKNKFKPIAGIRAYFQWFEDGGYVSPVYTAVSDANGRLNIGCKPYLAADGKLIKFDADPTVSGGHEKYRFWVDPDTIPEGYQLQYITGENIIFPKGVATVTQGGSGSDTPKNTHENWKILLMQKPKEEMHKDAKETPIENKTGGNLKGKVSWDYTSDAGGVEWRTVADHTTPAKDVTVRASYLSDYALKQIYSNDTAVMLGLSKPSEIRGSKWTAALEDQLQEWIKEQVKKDPENWIAETVTAKTNAEGKYIIQFYGIWGKYKNSDAGLKNYDYKVGDKAGGIEIGNKWTKEQIDRLGKVADDAAVGSFQTAKENDEKHINYDWLFVSTDDTENLRVMTPYNNNYYTLMHNTYGINSGWSGGSFGLGVTNALNSTLEADFVLGVNDVNFNITNYDTDANTAKPGDIAQTKTEGLPYSKTSDSFRIVWYDKDGKVVKEGKAQKPSSTGAIESEPFDTTGITKTTEFTAKLYRVDSKGKNADLIAVDSFVVVVENNITSKYDEYKYENPNPIKGATYSAKGLPEGLTIDPKTGNVSGIAKEAGKFDVVITATSSDESGELNASRHYEYIVTDSPLQNAVVNAEYKQTVKPTEIEGLIFENVSAKFIDRKGIDSLTITGDQISGTPTTEVEATEEDPNVEVTYDIYRMDGQGKKVLVEEGHVDRVPLKVEDKDGKETTVPEGTKFTLGKDAPKDATIDEKTGEIKYTPVDGDEKTPVEIPVVVTYPDNSTDEVTAKITVTKNNDTTKPEIGDLDDDDNPDTPVAPKEDENNKGPQVWANGARVTEGQKITPIKVNVTDDKDQNPTVEVTGLPEGLSYNKETGKIEGTPDKLTDWKDAEEERDFTATIKATDAAGNESTKEIQITVLRDTDGDGDPDTTDPDDDNDGINDDKDENPKSWDANVDGKVTTPKGTQPTVDQYKEKITNLPEGSKVVVKTEPDVSKAGDTEAVVTVTLPNGEEVDVTVPVTVTDTTPTEATAKPKINPVKAGDKEIKGKAEPNAKVVVELPDGTKVETKADGEGNWTVKVPEGKEPKENDVVKAVATVDGKNSSEEATATTGKADEDDNKTIADKTDPTIPSKTEVKDKNNLTDEEKDKVKKAIEDANKDKFPQGTKVEIGKDGTATITYPDGSVDIIKGNDLVIQKAKAGASGSINRVNSSNTGKNVKTGVGSSATILATLAAAVSGLFASKKRKND